MTRQYAVDDELINRCARVLEAADGLLICAGAGMGIDSGLPDFRGEGGFWRHYPALGRAGLGFTEIANPQAFDRVPRLAWGFYGHRLRLYRETAPHDGFRALLEFGQRMAHGAYVFTSNVDGQFQKAGFSEAQVYEVHGSIHRLQCSRKCREAVWPASGVDPVVDTDSCRLVSELPACPHCGAVARPNILMFNDWHWIDRQEGKSAALTRWLHDVKRLVVVEIGAGTDIPTVRRFAEAMNGTLIRINPTEPQVPGGRGIEVKMGGLAALQAIFETNWS